jgi:hypothetical protein
VPICRVFTYVEEFSRLFLTLFEYSFDLKFPHLLLFLINFLQLDG